MINRTRQGPRFWHLALALLLLHYPTDAQSAAPLAAQPAACAVPMPRDDGWPVATPARAGMDPQRLCALMAHVSTATKENVHAVIVARHGSLVFEHYAAGPDERWGTPVGRVEFGPTVKHDVRSVSKSITSLLVGIAIDRGLLRGVDEPVVGFFPEYADLRTPEKERIRLRHLLTMSSGLAWDETAPYIDSATGAPNAANSITSMESAPDRHRYVLEQPVVAPPGQIYNYSGGATELLAAVLRKATGQSLEEFARVALFEPLGISDVEWNGYPNGDPSASSGLRLRPRDVAKLGQLLLARGAWQGRRIVSASWLDESTSSHIKGRPPFLYGYQWWLGRSSIEGREIQWAAGSGYGGQRLIVVPALDLVVVMTAGLYQSPLQGRVPRVILDEHVLPAVRQQ